MGKSAEVPERLAVEVHGRCFAWCLVSLWSYLLDHNQTNLQRSRACDVILLQQSHQLAASPSPVLLFYFDVDLHPNLLEVCMPPHHFFHNSSVFQ